MNTSIKKAIKNRNSFPNEDSALTLIWSKLMEVEKQTYKYLIAKFYSCEKKLLVMLKKQWKVYQLFRLVDTQNLTVPDSTTAFAGTHRLHTIEDWRL